MAYRTPASQEPAGPTTAREDEGRSVRRYVNLLREAHRSARATPIIYPLAFGFVTVILTPFFFVEPESFDHPDHV